MFRHQYPTRACVIGKTILGVPMGCEAFGTMDPHSTGWAWKCEWKCQLPVPGGEGARVG